MRILTLLALPTLFWWASACDPNALFAQGKGKPKNNAEAKAPPATPFSTVVRANFASWDLNEDGELTPDEIQDAMTRPRVKGDVAAAIATLRFVERYHYERLEKKMPPFTLEQLQRYEAAVAGKRKLKHEFDTYFLESKRKLEQTPRELFPEKLP
jgi:hypothetical protein